MGTLMGIMDEEIEDQRGKKLFNVTQPVLTELGRGLIIYPV